MVDYEWHTHPAEWYWEALSNKDTRENKHFYKVKSTGAQIFDWFAGEYPDQPVLRTETLDYRQK